MTSDMGDLKALLGRVAGGEKLSETESETAFDAMMSGNAIGRASCRERVLDHV